MTVAVIRKMISVIDDHDDYSCGICDYGNGTERYGWSKSAYRHSLEEVCLDCWVKGMRSVVPCAYHKSEPTPRYI